MSYQALLLIDVQDSSVEEKYEIKKWDLTTLLCRKTLPNIEKLVSHFRYRGLPVVHILTTPWTKKYLEWNIVKLYEENPNAVFYSEYRWPKSCISIQGEKIFRKNMPSAFGGTDYLRSFSLSNYVAEKDWKCLAIAGFYSTGCVSETIIEGFNRNKLFWYVFSDCCQTFDKDTKQAGHKYFMTEHFQHMDGHVLTLNDII
ncbi:MAG: cysteine hydrolase [bacterium]|nr:cysteine hydrolase [bacterium]